MSEPLTLQARAAYRAVLRELPRRGLNRLATPTLLQLRIRAVFRTPHPQQPSTGAETERELGMRRIQEAQQLAQYAKAQRTYAALLERYNPGLSLDEEERIRLTARRVGLDLPVEKNEKDEGRGSGGGEN